MPGQAYSQRALRVAAAPRVVIVGSGIAGLTAALRVSSFADVTLLTKGALEESNTLYAQGGIAAALFDDDSVELHVADTLRAGAGLGDEDAVRILCSEGPDLVRELVHFGVPFDRDGRALARGLEAAHSRSRVLHAGGDATGRAIELTLAQRVRASGARVLEHTMLVDLVVDDGRVVGVRTIDEGGSSGMLAAEAVVLASGGAGRLYSHTTNPAVATGDGVAAAWRAGAELADLEFYQFHPTALAVPGGTLVSEAVRGEGAVLLDTAGYRFMPGVHRDAELAPRDIVARAIARQMQNQGAPVLLDATGLGRAFLARRFPTIQAACQAAGLDWAREPIPVMTAAHYWMGGVKTDAWARTSLPGLFAIGEVACTGVQGANRLASNSLLEGLVFAARAADALSASDLPRSPLEDVLEHGAERSERQAQRVDAGTANASARDRSTPAKPAPAAISRVRTELQETMWRHAGLDRDEAGLREASAVLDGFGRRVSKAGVSALDAHGGTQTIAEHEDRNLLLLATLVVHSAAARRESRGAHFRSDFPVPSHEPAHSVVINRSGEIAIRATRQLAREGLVSEVVAAC
ncbi:L-aspartate oxidase [Rathayibacter sp. KR2-224]|uniref:L-aspartate oxidase n=1 Tax=Rathayibacter sp. KR2-224 TaxID=3400913 RepID=UPI003C10C96D